MRKSYITVLIIAVSFLQATAVGKATYKAKIDSLHKAVVVHRRAVADSLRRNVVHQVFSIEYADSLLMQIEHLHSLLNTVTNQAKYGFKTQEIENNLQHMEKGIQVITDNLSRDSAVVNINNLQMFMSILQDMSGKLLTWKDNLYSDNSELNDMTTELNTYVQDSLTEKVAEDTAFANLHLDEMLILNERWHEAQTATVANHVRIAKLQASISSSYFEVIELENKVGEQLAGTGFKIFRKEYSYLWNPHNLFSFDDVVALAAVSFSERMRILAYYLSLNTLDWLIPVIIGLLFVIWIAFNYRKLKLKGTPEDLEGFSFQYLGPVPLLIGLIFVLNIAPFYGFNQPAIYVEVIQFVILIPLGFLFWRLWPRYLFRYWCYLSGLFLLTYVMNIIITPGWPLRFLLTGVNLAAIFTGFRFYTSYKKSLFFGKAVKPFIILFIILNLAALTANIAGRLTLAKIFTSAGVIGLTQILALFVLVPLFTEAFYLQMKVSRISGGMSAKFNFDSIKAGLTTLFTGGIFLLWLISFTTNLDVYNAIVTAITDVLNDERKVGSTTYTFGNILTFVVILFAVNILQKYVGNFFGETEDDFINDSDKKESRLVIFRLLIIVVGFSLAVVASGLPVDKVTVVLGALGVGIGLGLQNIVFNVVSGVILIFEKPMQVGDYIEVSDKKGRVQSIGLRSSRLVTSDGSEVTVPNGDISSSHMVNWTKSNNNRRTQLSLEIEPASELETAKDIILQELKHEKHVIQERPVEVFLNNLSEKSVGMQVNVWINSIYKEEEFKSEVLSKIYTRLAEKNIKMV